MSPAEPSLSRDALYERIWSEPLSSVARELGVSSPGLAKICARLMIPTPPRGYWSRRDRTGSDVRPPLPPAPEAGALPRPPRTRLAPEVRREQLLDAAAELITREGVAAATLKRIAREARVSETLLQSYFQHQAGVLIELARRELETIRAAQQAHIAEGSSGADRLARSTQAYLRQVAQRGALLQILLSNPKVRQGLRSEKDAERKVRREAVVERFTTRTSLPSDIGVGATVMLTGLCLRAGRLLARKRLSLEQAESLSLTMVHYANKRLVRLNDVPGPQGVEAP